MDHFVNDDVFEQVLGFLHQLSVEADSSGPMVAATPLGLHSLEEVTRYLNTELLLPFLDECRLSPS